MKKRQGRKNPHAVALGRLGGLVRSVAKQRANRENGRKGVLVKSRKKTLAVRRTAGPVPVVARSPESANRVDSGPLW